MLVVGPAVHGPARAVTLAFTALLLGAAPACGEAPASVTRSEPEAAAPVAAPLEPALAAPELAPEPQPQPEPEPGWKLRIKAAEITGDYDKYILRRTLAHHNRELHACARQGDKAGALTLQFILNDHGPQAVRVVSNHGSKKVGTCIAAALGAWQFPRPTCSPAIVKLRFEVTRA